MNSKQITSMYFFLSVLQLLMRPACVPAVICCAAGKDRTGLACALIQGMLGFSREEIVENYHQSAVRFKSTFLIYIHLTGY